MKWDNNHHLLVRLNQLCRRVQFLHSMMHAVCTSRLWRISMTLVSLLRPMIGSREVMSMQEPDTWTNTEYTLPQLKWKPQTYACCVILWSSIKQCQVCCNGIACQGLVKSCSFCENLHGCIRMKWDLIDDYIGIHSLCVWYNPMHPYFDIDEYHGNDRYNDICNPKQSCWPLCISIVHRMSWIIHKKCRNEIQLPGHMVVKTFS